MLLPVNQFGKGRGDHFDEVLKVLQLVIEILGGKAANFEFHTQGGVIAHAIDGILVLGVIFFGYRDDLGSVNDHLDVHHLRGKAIGLFH